MNKFWVVRDPTPNSTPEEVLMEFTSSEHAKYLFGCGLETYQNEHHAIHPTREAAVEDADARVAKAITKLRSLKTGFGPRAIDIWAELRGMVSLSEVVDMVRQDLEAEVGPTDEAQALAIRLMSAIDKAQGV